MNFSEKQSKEIYEFIMKYNADEEFKNKIQDIYDNNAYMLSILEIYALEEVLRYGSKELFNRFLATKGTYADDQAVDLFDGFIKLLAEDLNFRQYKTQQFIESPETLSELEMFAFTLISSSDTFKEQMQDDTTEELEYDPYNPIGYSTDNQIRETLENLFFGEFIHQMLELPAMQSIKARQKEDGRIANIDKPFIIEKIQDTISEQNSMSQFKQIIDSRFVKVKMELLLGKGEFAFEEYLKFNTNISVDEILGNYQDNTEEDIYDFFMNIINEKKNKIILMEMCMISLQI